MVNGTILFTWAFYNTNIWKVKHLVDFGAT
jgi:hypothetical protein